MSSRGKLSPRGYGASGSTRRIALPCWPKGYPEPGFRRAPFSGGITLCWEDDICA